MTHFYAEYYPKGNSSNIGEELRNFFQTKFKKSKIFEEDGFFLYVANQNENNMEIRSDESMLVFSMNKLKNVSITNNTKDYARNYQNDYSGVIAYYRESHEIEIITDPFGFDFIYMAVIDEKKIALASHMKYILSQHPHLLNKLNFDAITEYLFSHFILGWKTFFVDINLLPYNSIIRLSNWERNAQEIIEEGKIKKQSWYNFPSNYLKDQDITEKSAELADLFREFSRSIYEKHTGEVLLFLSGGLDSRLLLAAVNEDLKGRTKAITFDGSQNGVEISLAREVTKILKIRHHIEITSRDDIVSNCMQHMWVTEGMSNHMVSHLIKILEATKGNNVYLEGYMGDTQYGGSFFPALDEIIERYKSLPERLYETMTTYGWAFPEKVFLPIFNYNETKFKKILDQGVKEQSNLMWKTNNDKLELECLLVQTRGRCYSFGGSRTISNYGIDIFPYYHPEIFSKYIVLPPEIRDKRRFQNSTLTYLNPQLATLASTSLIWYRRLKIGAMGYKILLFLESIIHRKLIPTFTSFPTYEWAREKGPIRELHENILMNTNSLIWNILDSKETRNLFSDFHKRKNNYLKVLVSIIDLEITLRLFFSLRESNTDVRMISDVLKFDKHFQVDCDLTDLKKQTRFN